MSSPTSFRLPFVMTPDVHPDVQAAIRYAFSGIKDLQDAVTAIVPKLGGKGTVTENIVTNVSGGGGGGSAPSSIGTVNQQVTGAYSLLQADFGALVLLETAATFAVTLPNTLSAPFFTIIENECLGLATLTPTTGTVNNNASYLLGVGQFALVFFDGTNWWATTIPQTLGAVSCQWVDSYNAVTGIFHTSQPRASCLADSTVGSGPVVLDSSPTIFDPTLFAPMSIKNLKIFSSNANAIAGGLVVGNLYRDGSDPDHVCCVH
jgi:hypothetical protein